jgi:hypothetical protein
MNEIGQFESPCRYRDGSMYCSNGHIYVMQPNSDMAVLATMDGAAVKCPACKGIGYILTPAGIQLVQMMWRHLEHPMTELILELRPDENA